MSNFSNPIQEQNLANNIMPNFIIIKQDVEKEIKKEEDIIKEGVKGTELIDLGKLNTFKNIAKNWTENLKKKPIVLQSFYKEGKRAQDILNGKDLEYQLVEKFGKDFNKTMNLAGPMNLDEKILDAKDMAEKLFGKENLTIQDLCITRSIILIQQLYQQLMDISALQDSTKNELAIQRENSLKTKKDFLTMIEDLYGKCTKNLLSNSENGVGINNLEVIKMKSEIGQLAKQLNNFKNQEKDIDKKFENLAKLHNNELQAKINNLDSTISQKVDEAAKKKAASNNLMRMDVDDDFKMKNDTQDKKIVTLERDVTILKEQLNNNVKVQDHLIETNKSDLMATIKIQENRINNLAKNYNILLKKLEEEDKNNEWSRKPEISVEEIKTLIDMQIDAKTKGLALKANSLESELKTFKTLTMAQVAGEKVLELKQELEKKEAEKNYSKQIKGIEKKEKEREGRIKSLEDKMVKTQEEIGNIKKVMDEDKAEKKEVNEVKENIEKELKKIKEDLGKKANSTIEIIVNEQKKSLKTLTENLEDFSKKIEEEIDYIKVVLNVNDITEDNKDTSKERDITKDIFKINRRPFKENKETKEVSLKNRVDNLVRQCFNDKKEISDKIKQINEDIEKSKWKETREEVSMVLGTLQDIKNTVDENNKKIIKCEANIKILSENKDEESLNNELKLAEKNIKSLESQMSEHLEKLEEINKANQINKEKEKKEKELFDKEKLEKQEEMVQYKKDIESKIEGMNKLWEEFKESNKKEWEVFQEKNNLKDEWSELQNEWAKWQKKEQEKNKINIDREKERILKDSLKEKRKKKIEEISNTANIEEISQGSKISNAEVIADKIDKAIKTYNFININDLMAFKYIKQEEAINLIKQSKEDILKEINTEYAAIELLLNNMKKENTNFQLIKKSYIDEKNRILEDYDNLNEELKKNVLEMKRLQSKQENKQEIINTDINNKNLLDSSININEKNSYLFTSNNNINTKISGTNINNQNVFDNKSNASKYNLFGNDTSNENLGLFNNNNNRNQINLFGDETSKNSNAGNFVFNNNNNRNQVNLFGGDSKNSNTGNIFSNNISFSQSFHPLQTQAKKEENNIKRLAEDIMNVNNTNNTNINNTNNINKEINNDIKNNLEKWRGMKNGKKEQSNKEANKNLNEEEKEKKLFETGYQVLEKHSFQFSDLCLNLPDEIWPKLSPQEKKGFFKVKDNYIEERLIMINNDERLTEEEKEESKKMIEEMRYKIPIIVNGEIKGYKNAKGNYKRRNFQGARSKKEKWKGNNNRQNLQSQNINQNNNQNNENQQNKRMNRQHQQGNRGRRYWNSRKSRRRNNQRNWRRYGRRRNYRRRWRRNGRRNQYRSKRNYGRQSRRRNNYNRPKRIFRRRRNGYRRPKRRNYRNRRYQNRNQNWYSNRNRRWNQRNRTNRGRRPYRNNSH